MVEIVSDAERLRADMAASRARLGHALDEEYIDTVTDRLIAIERRLDGIERKFDIILGLIAAIERSPLGRFLR